MGCGGSRADAIEPRYYESWTRETESTWLTNTDSESPPQEGGSAEAGGREQGAPRPGSDQFPLVLSLESIFHVVKQIPSKQRVKRLLVLSGEWSSNKHPMEAGRKAHSSPLLPHACRTRVARRGMAQPCLVQVSLEGPAVPEGLHVRRTDLLPLPFPQPTGKHFRGTSTERLHRISMADTEHVEDANTFVLVCFASLSKIHIALEFR
ncbi:brain and acute leukemia cytoplasmic protein isoform 1-T1 [Ciconia maguari]